MRFVSSDIVQSDLCASEAIHRDRPIEFASGQRVPLSPFSPTDTEFAKLYIDHFDQVKAFLARTGCEAHALDDLAQEAFLRAWQVRGRFSGRSGVRTWLLGISKNVAREAWRTRIETRSATPEPTDAASDSACVQSEMSESIRRAVERLPPKQRVAITLVYFDGLTQTAAAIRTNCAHAAFRRRLSSGRTQLRRLLRERHTA